MIDKPSAIYQGIDQMFDVHKRGSTLRTEVRAGVATFLSLSYIFVLAPTFLQGMGFDAHHSLAVVIAVSAVLTFVAGWWARLPFAFAPGLEMLLYIVGVVVPMFELSAHLVTICVLGSGAVLAVLALARVTHRIHNYPPAQFLDAVAITMSVFLLCQAIRIAGIVSYDGGGLRFAHMNGAWIWGLTGTVVAFILDAVGVPAPVLFSVLLVSILARPAGVAELHDSSTGGLFFAATSHESAIHLWTLIRVTLTLVGLSLYGSLSKVVNLWQGSNVNDGELRHSHDHIPRMNRLIVVEGFAAVVSGLAGITNVTMFVESGAGIRVGGRTGIASIVTATAMLSALFLLPYIRYVEPVAAVGALVYVGVLLFPRPRYLKHISRLGFAIIAVMAGIVIGTMSLFWALAVGFVGFVLLRRMRNIGQPPAQEISAMV